MTDSFRRGSDVPFAAPRYVWDGLIPAGGISIIVGASGVGKSTLAALLAAKWTNGDLTGRREHVLMAMTEDSDSYTTMPRVDAHGGDLSRIHVPSGRPWSFPRDLAAFEAVVAQSNARVVILDPLQQFVRSLASQAARETLGELRHMATEMEIALIFLHHFIKGTAQASSVMAAMGGGYGVYGVARSILVFGWEPGPDDDADEDDEDIEDEDTGVHLVLAHEKHSTGTRHPSILYTRDARPHPAAPKDPRAQVSILRELRQVPYTPFEVMRAGSSVIPGAAEKVRPRESAKRHILTLLSDAGAEGLPASELEARVKAAGHSLITVKRARADLADEGTIMKWQTKDGRGVTAGWRWRLAVPESVNAK